MRNQLATADAVIARIAARQHGVVALAQLVDAGLTKSSISRRVRAGRLHRVFRGVYAVGHAGLSNEGWWMAAVLACGEGAALSHRSAAELWGMLDPFTRPVHVTVPGPGGRKQRAGIRIHRSTSLTDAVATRRGGIAVTAPARTIADLRATASAKVVRHAIREAEFRGLPIDAIGSDGTNSELERLFLRLCRRHGLQKPEPGVRIGPFTVDFLWRDRGLIVETDGYRGHRGRQAFEEDRARDNALMAMGYDVLRFTYRRVRYEPAAVAALVRARLSSV